MVECFFISLPIGQPGRALAPQRAIRLAAQAAKPGKGQLNSDLVDSYIRSFSSGGRGFGAPSVVQTLAIPLFDPEDGTHQRLASLSAEAHRRVRRGLTTPDIDEEVNQQVRILWSIAS